MCPVSRACGQETHARQHISSVYSTFSYMEDNSCQQEYDWSVWLPSICKLGLISSLIGSPCSCGTTTPSQKTRPQLVHITTHSQRIILFYALMRLTRYAQTLPSGVVVKASTSRAEDTGFESCLRRDFSGVKSYQ